MVVDTNAYLQVTGSQITLDGRPILLKGASLGGWMLMENFMGGFTGQENQARSALAGVLGPEKAAYFFDRWLEHYFTDGDAALLAKIGFNCVRIAVNYRHFEDDLEPRVLKPDGFRHLDRVVDLCARHGIYTVIDLHALPGGQNIDWHSDNNTNQALFWDHKDFQDRAVWLWEQLATHYRDNTWVAGYNPMNEPTDAQHTRLQAFYLRIEKAIRAVDPDHILFLEHPLPNCVYSCHDYSVYGFPSAPERYTGTDEQIAYHERTFQRKADFMLATGTPIWNSEFGPTYAIPADKDWEAVNAARYDVLRLQLDINRRHGASYSLWTYKDIGVMGLVYPDAGTPLLRLLAPFIAKKKAVSADGWGFDETPVKHVFGPLEEWFAQVSPGLEKAYPPTWKIKKHVLRQVRGLLLSEQLASEWASYFAGMDEDELDQLARSWHIGE
ncbi:hypothetical protein CcaverHIS002_0207070 [Cutaneotrichosporon cavernicola]|nr:hypothetical protein CcaverHIS002_0207070 [Cutaneotrichosporon cavernicola]